MYGNHYYGQPQRYNMMDNMYNNPYTIPSQPMNNQNTILGKIVDSLDVVKATDIPLDGSTSYFPLTDGSAIITKKLTSDGTSKTVVYKPEIEKEVTYATTEDLDTLRKEIEKLKESKAK